MLKTDKELNERIDERKRLQMKIKELEDEVKVINAEIQKDMDERGVEDYRTDLYHIMWRLVERKDLDKEKMKADGIILENYQKISCYTKLDIR